MLSLNGPYDQLFYGMGKPDVRSGRHLETRVVIIPLAKPKGLAEVFEEPSWCRRDGDLTQVAKVLAQPAGGHEPDGLTLLLALGTVRPITGTRNQSVTLSPVVTKSANLQGTFQKY